MAAYFRIMMGHHALNWLEALPAGSINSWQDLCNAFVQYYQASCPGPKTRWDQASVKQQLYESLRDYIKRYFANCSTITEDDDRDVIYHFNEGLHNIKLWRKMFESNPKTVGDMMLVVNKHADMKDAKRAHRRHKTQNDSSERPPQWDNRSERRRDDRPPRHGKKHDRAESSKNRDRKRGPENTVAVAERSQFCSTLNQADLDRLLDGKCPWHKDANHTARECRALSNGIVKDDDPKRPRHDDRDRPGGSRTTQARPRRRNSPRRDDDEQREDSPGNFQEEDRAVNFIYGGPSKPSSRRKLKLDDREVNLVFKHPVESLRWSETPITFDRHDHQVHLPRPGAYPLVVSPMVSQVRLAKVLVDGGSAFDIIFASLLRHHPRSWVDSGRPGHSASHLRTRDNYHTEYVNFEVAEFETSYHAILGTPSVAKFMAIPNHMYLLLKMPTPKGVLLAAKNLPVDQQQIPAKESTSESQLAPAVATKTIVLQDDEPQKTAVIGASLDSA
ncbi:uncharacterized protein LOC120669119 [Panicum virgatum]|uniref:uncharacterized protein LOC120669119 n=1 Tax=Panicum virgatum TaxID=38727 RepID=UPI0019D4FF0B|nr:uncharacterized protein LOC120669119 [Panicum virgatum]